MSRIPEFDFPSIDDMWGEAVMTCEVRLSYLWTEYRTLTIQHLGHDLFHQFFNLNNGPSEYQTICLDLNTGHWDTYISHPPLHVVLNFCRLGETSIAEWLAWSVTQTQEWKLTIWLISTLIGGCQHIYNQCCCDEMNQTLIIVWQIRLKVN